MKKKHILFLLLVLVMVFGNMSLAFAVDVESITVTTSDNATEITTNGGTLQLFAKVLPENATDKSITWQVINLEGKATISPDGLLTAVENGIVLVRARANDGSTIYTDVTITISGQTTAPANPTYTVTYDGNGKTGGNVPVDSSSYEEGESVTVLGNTEALVRIGYTFAGWNTQVDGKGIDYVAKETLNMGTSNVTLYAKWTPALGSLVIEGATTTERPQSAYYSPVTEDYTVKAYDTNGDTMTLDSDNYHWSVSTAQGVSISGNKLSITEKASAGEVTLEVYNEVDEKTKGTLKITVNPPGTSKVLKDLYIAGYKDSLNIPTEEGTVLKETYEPRANNVYNNDIVLNDYVWSVVDSITGKSLEGVSIDKGVLSVTNEAKAGDTTIRVYSQSKPSIVGEYAVTLKKVLPTLDHLTITGPIEYEVPAIESESFKVPYTVTAYDSDNKEIDLSAYEYQWSTTIVMDGVSVDNNGLVTISDKAEADKKIFLSVFSSCTEPPNQIWGNLQVELKAPGTDTTVDKLEAIPPQSTKIEIPETDDVTKDLEVIAKNKYGNNITNPTLVWEVVDNPNGVSVSNGTLTITKDAKPMDIIVKASANGKSMDFKLSLKGSVQQPTIGNITNFKVTPKSIGELLLSWDYPSDKRKYIDRYRVVIESPVKNVQIPDIILDTDSTDLLTSSLIPIIITDNRSKYTVPKITLIAENTETKDSKQASVENIDINVIRNSFDLDVDKSEENFILTFSNVKTTEGDVALDTLKDNAMYFVLDDGMLEDMENFENYFLANGDAESKLEIPYNKISEGVYYVALMTDYTNDEISSVRAIFDKGNIPKTLKSKSIKNLTLTNSYPHTVDLKTVLAVKNSSDEDITDYKFIKWTYEGDNDSISIDNNGIVKITSKVNAGNYKFKAISKVDDSNSCELTLKINQGCSSGGSSSNKGSSSKKDNTVKGKADDTSFSAGTKKTAYNSEGKKETIVTVKERAIKKQVDKVDEGDKISIPVEGNTDISKGIFSVQSIKDMQKKDLVLEVQTDNATYELPTGVIDVKAISEEIGEEVELEDIPFTVTISKTNKDMVKVVETSAKKEELAIVVPPVDFEIEAAYKGKRCKVNKFNAFVTRTIEIPSNVNASKITTAIITEADGSVRHVPTYVTKLDGKYYATINALTNSTYTLIYNEITFSDVTDSHWAKADIEKMASRLVVEGKQDGTFCPDEAITRAELAQIIVKALGLKPVEIGKFVDVETGTEYAGYIGTAYSYGIIKGTSETTFNPNGLVTRQDAMTMIYRAGVIADMTNKNNKTDMTGYVDYEDVSDYAKTAVIWNVENGIIIGKTNTTLVPFENITRAELSTVTNRFLSSAGLIE